MIRTKKVVTKAHGKINIGLNVLGSEGGYHKLDTVAVGIDLYDEIAVTARRDASIRLDVRGFLAEDIAPADNNAYRAAAAFQRKFGTKGVDIRLKKNIPVGSGLGGSSADIVGVVKGMAELYGVSDGWRALIDELCSDGAFLSDVGAARLKGRGSVAERFVLKNPLHVVIAVPDCASSTADVFRAFDGKPYPSAEADIDEIVSALRNGAPFPTKEVFNALALPAMELNPEIGRTYRAVADLSPSFLGVSGSGSAVYGVFETVELCAWAREKLSRGCKWTAVCKTVNG